MSQRADDRKLQRSRINQAGYIVILVFLVLLARLWYLQVALGDDLLKAAEANRIKLLRTRSPRGTIFDRKGRILATSRPQFVVLAVPERLHENEEALSTLCDILHMTPEEMESIMQKRESRPGSPVRVMVDAPLDVVAQIGELRMKLPGVSVELDQIRYYPDGPAVAHIMGYLGEINQEELDRAQRNGENYQLGDYVGKAGLEKQYESLLHGIDGGRKVEVNAFGRVVRILGEEPSKPGKNLKLTIDRDLQIAADRSMGSQIGGVVAINPQTGEVLAMVSKPAYDPNVFVTGVKPSDWSKIIHDKRKPLQNRCIYNIYHPGSTFKPIMAVAGLKYHECTLNTTVSCPGSFYFGRTFQCWKRHGGGVNFMRAIAESCNVWFYKLGHRLEIDRISGMAKQFGLGSKTGIDLPGESPGIMPSREWKKKLTGQDWWPGETLSVAIGQGSVSASPLQMSVVCAGVSNNGKIYKPHLLEQILNRNGERIPVEPELERQVDAPVEDFALVQQAMRRTVTEGTGRVTNLEGVTVAGKTGSAQTTGGAAHGWYICFAPVEKPEIAIACIVEHGAHGASSAAPVCRAILDVYFGKKNAEDIEQKGAKVHGD